MPGVARLGDADTGHPCYGGRPSNAANGTVTANGKLIMGVGCSGWPSHCCGPACHGSSVAQGSSTVFVEGCPVARVGDPLDCSSIDFCDEHSGDVNAGG